MTLRTTPVARILSTIIYLALFAAGFSTVLFPAATFANAVMPIVAIAWSLLMTVGAAMCLYATVRDRLLGELGGLPALIIGVSIYVIVLVYRTVVVASVINVGGTILVLGLGVALLGLLILRRFELGVLIRASKETPDANLFRRGN